MAYLRQFIDERELTQAELSRMLDVSEALVSLYVNNEREPSDSFRWKFYQKFGAEAAETVFGQAQQELSA